MFSNCDTSLYLGQADRDKVCSRMVMYNILEAMCGKSTRKERVPKPLEKFFYDECYYEPILQSALLGRPELFIP